MTKKENKVQEPEYVDIEVTNETPEEGEVLTGSDVVRMQEGFEVVSTALSQRPAIFTPEYIEASEELSTGLVRQEYVQKKGRNDYISHTHATRTMNMIFRENWEYRVLNYEMFDDGSVAARCSMKVKYNTVYGKEVREFIEVGTFVPQANAEGEIFMGKSDRVASAVSRGLLRCMFRAFGYGAHLYKDDHVPMTKNRAWGLLRRYGLKKGLTEEQIVKALKDNGYTQDNLVDKYNDATVMLLDLAKGLDDDAPPLD